MKTNPLDCFVGNGAEREKKKASGASGASGASAEVDLQLNARFSSFTLNLVTCGIRLTEISISGLQLMVTLQPSMTYLEASLQQFGLVNPSGSTAYRDVAKTVDGEALRTEVKLFHHGAAEDAAGYLSDMDMVDVAFKLKMGRLKAVYLSCYVADVLDFINHFQDAKTALIEASSAAASAAKQNVQRVYVQVNSFF